MALQWQCVQLLLTVLILSTSGQESLLPQLKHCDIKLRRNASRSDELTRLRNCQYACQSLEETQTINAAGTQCLCRDVDQRLREIEVAQANENTWMKCNEEINSFCRDQYCPSCRDVLVPSIVESAVPVPGLSLPGHVGKKSVCLDINSLCEDFAVAGECARTPVYMLANCARSCGFCTLQEVVEKWQQGVYDKGHEESEIGAKLLQVQEQQRKERERLKDERRIRLKRVTRERRLELKRRTYGQLELLQLLEDYEALRLVVCRFSETSTVQTEADTCRNTLIASPCSRNELTNSSRYTMCLLPVIGYFRQGIIEAKILMNKLGTSRLRELQASSTEPVISKDPDSSTQIECRQQLRQRERDLQMEVQRLRNELDSTLQRERFLLWFLGSLFGGIVFLGGAVVFRMLVQTKRSPCIDIVSDPDAAGKRAQTAIGERSVGSGPTLHSGANTFGNGSPTKKPFTPDDGSNVKQRVHAINASQSYLWNGKVLPINSKAAEISPSAMARDPQ